MSFLTKVNKLGEAEFVLHFNPCDLGFFYQFTKLTDSNLKEIVFYSFQDFAKIDTHKLPLNTRLTIMLSLEEIKFISHPSREVYFLVKFDFNEFAKDPKTYLAPLIQLNDQPRTSYSILIHRLQYEFFMQTVKRINESFQIPIDFTLDYFDSSENITDSITFWKKHIGSIGNDENFKTMTFPFYDKAHNFIKRRTLIIKGSQLFLSPQLYQNLNQGFKSLEIVNLDLESIEAKVNELTLSQLQSANSMEKCADCKNLIFCSGKFTLAAMEELKIKNCPYPSLIIDQI